MLCYLPATLPTACIDNRLWWICTPVDERVIYIVKFLPSLPFLSLFFFYTNERKEKGKRKRRRGKSNEAMELVRSVYIRAPMIYSRRRLRDAPHDRNLLLLLSCFGRERRGWEPPPHSHRVAANQDLKIIQHKSNHLFPPFFQTK
jgi:hypothetical protein